MTEVTMRKENSLRVITVEEHFHHPEVGPPRVMDLSGPPPIDLDADFSTFWRNFTPPDRELAEQLAGGRLEHMDAAGINIQVLSHGAMTPPGSLDHPPDATGLCRQVNDWLAEQISQYPTRFRGFATVPLYDPKAAADEMRRCIDELGFVGTLTQGTFAGLFFWTTRDSNRCWRPPRN